MKLKLNQLAKIGIFILGISLIFLTACETDNETIEIETNTKYRAEKVEFTFYQTNASLIEKVIELNTLEQTGGSKNRKSDSGQTYTININEAIYIENTEGTHHTYTFEVVGQDSLQLQNVVLSLQPDGDYKAHLTTYQLTEQERIDLSNGIAIDLTQKTSIKEIDNSQVKYTSRAGGSCWNLERVGQQDCTHEAHQAAHAANGYCTHPSDIYEWVEVSCPRGAGNGNTTSGETGGNSSGGDISSGDNTVPTAPKLPTNENGDTAAPAFLINALGDEVSLTSQQIDWINNPDNLDVVVDILQSLYDDQNTAEAKIQVAMRIDSERAKNNWVYSPGSFPNRPALSYTHKFVPKPGERMYLLENGLVLYQSSTRRQINKSNIPDTIGSTEVATNGYNYIYNYGAKKWFEYRLPPEDFPNADIDFLFDAFWKGAKIVGRYATPVEDIIILVDGKDFDGIEQSKVQTAGFMIVGFIPGGKAFKPVAKIVNGISKYRKVVKVTVNGVNKSISLPIKIVNGVVDFGSTSKLRKTLGMGPIAQDARQAHHLMPRAQAIKNHDVIQKAAKSEKAFHIDEALNGIPVEAWRNQPNHDLYNDLIESKLDEFNTITNPLADNDEAYDFIIDLIDQVEDWIINNPNSHLNDLVLP